MGHSTRCFLLGTALLGGMACAGRSQSSPPPARSNPPPAAAAPAGTPVPAGAADSTWLKSDSTGRSVSLTLVVAKPSGGPSALLNGHRSGDARIVVPLRWTVKWDWRNDDPGTAHSLWS